MQVKPYIKCYYSYHYRSTSTTLTSWISALSQSSRFAVFIVLVAAFLLIDHIVTEVRLLNLKVASLCSLYPSGYPVS